jgi:hypothetical protein
MTRALWSSGCLDQEVESVGLPHPAMRRTWEALTDNVIVGCDTQIDLIDEQEMQVRDIAIFRKRSGSSGAAVHASVGNDARPAAE